MMELVFNCGGAVGSKFPLRYEMEVEMSRERARKGDCGYGNHNVFMFETFF